MKKSMLYSIALIVATYLFIGCSENSTPVSVNNDNITTKADIGNAQVQDIACSGDPSNLWALSWSRVTNVDYKLLKYEKTGNYWHLMPNYGKMVTVARELCFHANSSEDVWWTNGTDKSGKLDLNNMTAKIDDIAAGYNYATGRFILWVVGTDSDGNRKVCYHTYRWDSSHSVLLSDVSVDLSAHAPLGNKIACDPDEPKDAVIIKNNIAWYSTNLGGSWIEHPSTYQTKYVSECAVSQSSIAVKNVSNDVYIATLGNNNFHSVTNATNVRNSIAFGGDWIYYIDANYWTQKASKYTY